MKINKKNHSLQLRTTWKIPVQIITMKLSVEFNQVHKNNKLQKLMKRKSIKTLLRMRKRKLLNLSLRNNLKQKKKQQRTLISKSQKVKLKFQKICHNKTEISWDSSKFVRKLKKWRCLPRNKKKCNFLNNFSYFTIRLRQI